MARASSARMSPPSWDFDDAIGPVIIGVDEVGRGPLFGPVVAAAVHIPAKVRSVLAPLGINDSKKVPVARRERIFTYLTQHAMVGVGSVSAGQIDHLGIGKASLLAMKRALLPFESFDAIALIDGRFCPPGLTRKSEAVIGGDRKSVAIAAASIIAKVARDQAMENFNRLWPDYGLAQHKGYPTDAHRKAIVHFGLTPCHRRSFRGCQEKL